MVALNQPTWYRARRCPGLNDRDQLLSDTYQAMQRASLMWMEHKNGFTQARGLQNSSTQHLRYTAKDIANMKREINKSQKLISITDSFSKKFYQIRISEDLISLGYTLKDNSPEDLEMLVKEFLNFIKNSKKSKKHKIVQNYVKSIPKAIDSDFETESHFSVSFFHKYYSTDIKGKVI